MSRGREKPAVCFVSAEHPAFDKRVFEKEAISLARAGYEVSHVCPGKVAGRESVRGVEVVTYTRRPGRAGRLLGLGRLFRLARSTGADAYHCNEPDSWLVGMAMRLLFGKLVIFDCHEHYLSRFGGLRQPLRAVAGFFLRYYLQIMGLLTHLVVLAKYSVADDLSWSSQRQVVVLNTSKLEVLQQARVRAPGAAVESGSFAFVHIGIFARERGSEQLLDAMAELVRRGRRDYRVVLIGEFFDGSEDDFFEKATAAGIRDLITFHAWMPFEKAFDIVCSCQAGLVLFQKDVLNNVYGMPHKMFDYMLAGLPVIGPDFAPDIVRVLRDSGAGLLIDTSDARRLADTMQGLMDDRRKSAEIGRLGQQACLTRYHWEADARTLLGAYRDLFRRRGLPAPATAARA